MEPAAATPRFAPTRLHLPPVDHRWRPLLLGVAVGVVLFWVLLLALWAFDVEVRHLVGDVTDSSSDVPVGAGLFSNLGLLGWGAAVGAAAVTGWARRSRFFLTMAAVAAVLGVDDAVLLHEELAPSAGVPEPAVLVAQAGVAAWFAWSFRHRLARTPWPLLVVAAGCSAVALVLDRLPVSVTFEEMLEYAGQVAFIAWCTATSMAALRD